MFVWFFGKVSSLAQIGFFPQWLTPRKIRNFRAGLLDVGPALIAVSTWAFVTGIALVKSGLTESMAALMTLLVYAGSAQLTALPLIESGAPLWLIFAAGFVVNIRFVIFGAALQPYFRHYTWPKRLVLGFFSSDIVFVLFMGRFGDSKRKGTTDQLWYYLGVIVPGWFAWQFFSMAGIFMGSLVPESWSLHFAATLALMAIVIPLVTNRPVVVCLITAAFIAWVGQPLPLRLGLAGAVVGGVIAGVVAERSMQKRKAR
jgi:predicted branched-subunit amino acid permease